MEYRILEINVLSATDLKDVNFMSNMAVYVVASIDGDPHNQKQKAKTPVDHDGGKSPTWNFPMKFTINEAAAQQNRLTLEFAIRCDRALGDKDVGLVIVPIKELLSPTDGEQEGKKNDDKPMKLVTYQVRRPSGRAQGELSLSYKMGEKLISDTAHGVATAYPVGAGPSSSHLVGGPYPPPPAQPPPPQGYGYPQPPPPQHGGYGYAYPPPPLPPSQGGYGYAAPPPPGYGYAQPVQQPANKKNKFGMGLGAGLIGGALGGLLIGDMVSDAAGFDDAGGFDF